MIASAPEPSLQQTSPYIWRNSFLRTLGLFGPSVVWLAQGLFWIWSGSSNLGLFRPIAYMHDIQQSYVRAALYLLLGGCLLAVGLIRLMNKLNQKAA
jgi:hypothetical protein